mgnify:CR=1 FL=1
MTSATIKVDDSFDYFLNRNGLSDMEDIMTNDYISPFSYGDQVTYYQYGGTRDITGDSIRLADLIYYIHKTFQKRTMVLFTSVKMLSDVSKKIKENVGISYKSSSISTNRYAAELSFIVYNKSKKYIIKKVNIEFAIDCKDETKCGDRSYRHFNETFYTSIPPGETIEKTIKIVNYHLFFGQQFTCRLREPQFQSVNYSRWAYIGKVVIKLYFTLLLPAELLGPFT